MSGSRIFTQRPKPSASSNPIPSRRVIRALPASAMSQPSTYAAWGPRTNVALDGFPFGRAELTDAQRKQLAYIAEMIRLVLEQYPDSFVSVTGFTDAVGGEEDNVALGGARAQAAANELRANGVPSEILRTGSLGKSIRAVETQQPEPRNRRVEIYITARNFFPLPPAKVGGTPLEPVKPVDVSRKPLPSPGPDPRNVFKIPPAAPKPTIDPIEAALDKDPVIQSIPAVVHPFLLPLPKSLQDKVKQALKKAVKDAVKSGDETIIEKALDTLKVSDDDTKEAIVVAVLALWAKLKGKNAERPTPPLHEIPPSVAPPVPEAPEQTIFEIPFEFD